MRAFIALELSDTIKGILAQVQSHLKYAAADVKWVEPANIHLTLKFLGEITEEKSEQIKAVLDDVANSSRPFELTLKDVGAFPGIDNPHVIWVGLDKGAKESAELAAGIDEKLSKIGFAKEPRPFAAHLTIGRVRSGKNTGVLKEKIAGCKLEKDYYQKTSSIILFRSKLTPHGSVYTKLHESKLHPGVQKMPGAE